MFAFASMSVSSETYVNCFALGLYSQKRNGYGHETWYTLTSMHECMRHTMILSNVSWSTDFKKSTDFEKNN